MSEKIEPALTPEEWAYIAANGWPAPHDGCGVPSRDNMHAMAARCLYGQTFGFTHEDVGLLRELAASAEWAADNANGGEGSAEAAVAISPLESLADRIAALLPPEGTQ